MSGESTFFRTGEVLPIFNGIAEISLCRTLADVHVEQYLKVFRKKKAVFFFIFNQPIWHQQLMRCSEILFSSQLVSKLERGSSVNN